MIWSLEFVSMTLFSKAREIRNTWFRQVGSRRREAQV